MAEWRQTAQYQRDHVRLPALRVVLLMSDYDPDHMADAVEIIAMLEPSVIRSDEELAGLPVRAVVLDAVGQPWKKAEDGLWYGVRGAWMMAGPVVHLHGFWEE